MAFPGGSGFLNFPSILSLVVVGVTSVALLSLVGRGLTVGTSSTLLVTGCGSVTGSLMLGCGSLATGCGSLATGCTASVETRLGLVAEGGGRGLVMGKELVGFIVSMLSAWLTSASGGGRGLLGGVGGTLIIGAATSVVLLIVTLVDSKGWVVLLIVTLVGDSKGWVVVTCSSVSVESLGGTGSGGTSEVLVRGLGGLSATDGLWPLLADISGDG